MTQQRPPCDHPRVFTTVAIDAYAGHGAAYRFDASVAAFADGARG